MNLYTRYRLSENNNNTSASRVCAASPHPWQPWVKPKGPHGCKLPSQARSFMKQMKLASWNVRTMSDVTTSKRQAPERRSALISAELKRFNTDLACLSDCRILVEGEFVNGDYTFQTINSFPSEHVLIPNDHQTHCSVTSVFKPLTAVFMNTSLTRTNTKHIVL